LVICVGLDSVGKLSSYVG